MASEVWSGLMGIAMALIALAFFTLVIGRSGQASQVITASANSLGSLLGVVTLQSSGFGGMLGGTSFNSGLVA